MSTSFDTIFKVFYDKIEKDEAFFNYYNLTTQEAFDLAQERAESYLIESIVRLTIKCTPDIDFRNYDLENKVINEDITDIEVEVLANLMFEKYISRDIAKLKAFEVNFTPTDLQVFSPSQSRKSFMDMYKEVKNDNKEMLALYASVDRLTGKKKVLDYSSFE